MQVVPILFLLVAMMTCTVISTPLPFHHTSISSGVSSSSIGSPSMIWKRKFFSKKKSEEDFQEEIRDKVLLSTGPIKSKYLRSMSDKDLHTFAKEHFSRLNNVESNKMAKYLEKKAAEQSYLRAQSLDAIAIQLKSIDYERAHWAGNYRKTAALANSAGPSAQRLHEIITESQKEIDKIHTLAQDLDVHIHQLWDNHKAEREKEAKKVKTDVEKSLQDAHKKVKEINKYPNLRETYERQVAKQKAKEELEAKEAKEKEEKKAAKKPQQHDSSSMGWPLRGKIGKMFGYGSSKDGSSKNGSGRSSYSADDEAGSGKSAALSTDSDREGSGRNSGRSSAGSRDDDDGSPLSQLANNRYGSSSGSSSPGTTFNSPDSVIPGYQGSPLRNSYRKSGQY